VIDVGEALRRLAEATAPLDAVEVVLERSDGLVLAEPIAADRDYPPTDRSAMDGFAVRAADCASGRSTLAVVGEVRAGRAPEVTVTVGTAARIMTGAIVPPGADAVVMVERSDEDRERGTVTLDDRPVAGQNVRHRGEERRGGDPVLDAGAILRAAEIAALGAIGRTRVRVHRPPTVGLLSTGDEIVEPESVPGEHQVRNSNAVALAAQTRELGIEVRYGGIAPDDESLLDEALERASANDVLLVTGGVSAGEHDLVEAALLRKGARLLFHGVAMKPGKPVLAARLGQALVFGLPGNPVSTFTVFAVLVAPVLRRMMGHRQWQPAMLPVRLEREVRGTEGRGTYHLARLRAGEDALWACPTASSGSGDVLSLPLAHGFVVTGPGRQVHPAGETLPFLPWRGVP
jgi:molybdopterin molybdotransferase